jgi:glycosyltransferase involved in cell wall biosynthesis
MLAKAGNRKLSFNPGDLIVNQGTLFTLIEQNRIDLSSLSDVGCYFTHDSKSNLINYRGILTQLRKILVMNLQDMKLLVEIGVDARKILIVYGAVDSNVYYPREDLRGLIQYIYVTGDAKGRKNPEKIVDLIEASPELHFVINGRFWLDYLRKAKIHPRNCEVLEFEPNKNPELMRNASCFLSLSLHEGGPYPVLEALASGTPVVATPTGWNPELISDSNGRLVAFDISIAELKLVLQEMINLKGVVYRCDLTNGDFTWAKLATLLYES